MTAGTWTEQKPKTRAKGTPQKKVDKEINKKRLREKLATPPEPKTHGLLVNTEKLQTISR